MPITNAPTATSFGAMPSPTGGSAGFGGIPGLNLNIPGYQTTGLTPQQLQNLPVNFSSIQQLLSQQPQSVTNTLMPGLMSILGLQTQQLGPMFGNQASQMASAAQSDAMARGLTGSSIEAASLLGARQAAAQNQSQFVGQQLGQLGQAYTGAIGQDVQSQNQMYQDLAQALGQKMQSDIQQQQFQQQLQAMQDQARMSANASMWSGAFQGLGALGGGLLAHSDPALKKNVEKVGQDGPLGVYEFEYRTDEYPELNLPKGRHRGFMADEVFKVCKEAVRVINGFLAVDYARLAQGVA